jgi:hypothetical protein
MRLTRFPHGIRIAATEMATMVNSGRAQRLRLHLLVKSNGGGIRVFRLAIQAGSAAPWRSGRIAVASFTGFYGVAN